MNQLSITGETDNIGLAVRTMKTPAMSKDVVLGYAFRVLNTIAGLASNQRRHVLQCAQRHNKSKEEKHDQLQYQQ